MGTCAVPPAAAHIGVSHLVRVQGRGATESPEHPAAKFPCHEPNTAWVTDISYIRTWQGWLYLAVVTDLFSRKIVGWSTRVTITRELVLEAVMVAIRRRRPRMALIHSDQGSQYGSDDWRRFYRSNHLEPNMSRRGNCWENSVAESFFSILKKERIKKKIYRTREIAAFRVVVAFVYTDSQTGRFIFLRSAR